MASLTERYTDFYGCLYKIQRVCKGYCMKAYTASGKAWHNKVYRTYHGAKIALGKIADGTARPVKKES